MDLEQYLEYTRNSCKSTREMTGTQEISRQRTRSRNSWELKLRDLKHEEKPKVTGYERNGNYLVMRYYFTSI